MTSLLMRLLLDLLGPVDPYTDESRLLGDGIQAVADMKGRCTRLEHENKRLRSRLLSANGASPRPEGGSSVPGSSTL